MRIAGIIAEYNPFHQGHAYHIEETRRQTQADAVLVLMSGSHVQRGEPSVYDKYYRTRMALEGGADVVFEMPAAFSTASAREFASYGVSFFAKIGADVISFGSESGKIDDFYSTASLLHRQEADPAVQIRLKEALKKGCSYPEARLLALQSAHGTQDTPNTQGMPDTPNTQGMPDTPNTQGMPDTQTTEFLLSSPNNLLGLEYVSAYLRLKEFGILPQDLEFFTIPRAGMGYHQVAVNAPADLQFPSATALRRSIFEHAAEPSGDEPWPVFPSDYSSLLNYCLLRKADDFEDILDLNDALRQKLLKLTPDKRSFEEVISALKSRDLTYTRISRALLHLILDIRESDFHEFQNHGYASYARILGFRKNSSHVLRALQKNSSIPLITKLADMDAITDPVSQRMLEQEILASHIYQNIQQEKSGHFKNEFRQGPVIL